MNKKLIFGLCILVLFSSGCLNDEEFNSCITGDYEEEKHCFTALAYERLDPGVCEKMPDDVNRRQANKAFCLGFVASATGRVKICRDQNNQYYRNYCERVYERYFMSYDPKFEELKERYSDRE